MSLPLTVIGGYLGAGKTTLINRLLAENHGLRLLILVNDFGAINIDASLIEAAEDDMIALSNGCVCCTMGADLFLAIGDILDRDQLPDHLIVEASGIADPSAIAQVALAEPDLEYGGIVTVVDAIEFDRLSQDTLIGAQVLGQVDVADVVLVSKTEGGLWPNNLDIEALALSDIDALGPLVCDISFTQFRKERSGHPSYIQWQVTDCIKVERSDLIEHLARRPTGLFRLKGFLPAPKEGIWEIQCVGRQVIVRPGTGPIGIVGIGLESRVRMSEINSWWEELNY